MLRAHLGVAVHRPGAVLRTDCAALCRPLCSRPSAGRRGRRRACTTCLWGRSKSQPQVSIEVAPFAPPQRCAARLRRLLETALCHQWCQQHQQQCRRLLLQRPSFSTRRSPSWPSPGKPRQRGDAIQRSLRRQQSGAVLFVLALLALGVGFAYRSWRAGRRAPDLRGDPVVRAPAPAKAWPTGGAAEATLLVGSRSGPRPERRCPAPRRTASSRTRWRARSTRSRSRAPGRRCPSRKPSS